MRSISASLGVSKEHKNLFLIMYFAFLGNGLTSQLLGAILPFMAEEYRLSSTLQGMLISCHQVGNLCALFIAGYLPYAIGRKKSTVILDSAKSLGLLLMLITGNPFLLIIAFVFTGMGRGTLSNICNVVISEVTEKKASALNILHSCFSVGAIASPFIVMVCTRKNGGNWKLATGLILAFETVALLLIAFSRLEGKGKARQNRGENAFFHDPRWWACVGILFLYLCGEASIIGWLISYFKADGRLSPAVSQLSSSLFWVTMLAGRIACALTVERISKDRLVLLLSFAQILAFLLLLNVKGPTATVIMLLLLGLSMSGIYPTIVSMLPKQYNSSTIATGDMMAISNLGAIIMPTIVGAVAETYDIRGGIATIAISMTLMAILVIVKVFLDRKAEKA